ncbi:S8 family serine peptidase [Candidatus Harpocratesius sp.]
MKIKIFRMIIIIFLVIGTSFGFNSIEVYDNISGDKMDIKQIKQYPFFDPKLEELSKRSDNLEEIISVIITSQPKNFERMNNILQSNNIEIVSSFQEFSSVEVKCKFSEIIHLKFNSYISGIYYNLPQKVSFNREIKLLSDNNRIPYNSAEENFSSSFNLSAFLDRQNLADSLGIQINQTYGKNTVIAVLDAGVDGSVKKMNQYEEFNLDINGFIENYERQFINQISENQTVNLNILADESFVPHDPMPYLDISGTGTNFAGIAAGLGKNNFSYVGVATNASILNVKILDYLGLTYYSFILSGLHWSLVHDADIIMIPWSFPGYNDDPICLAVDALVEKGVVVITAAGDDGPSFTSLFSPAQSKRAIRVGAYDPNIKDVANFSSRGSTFDMRQGIDLIAPGVNIAAPVSSQVSQTENFTLVSGTGASTAIVAGISAILLSIFPSVTPDLLKIALMKSAQPTSLSAITNSEGFGLVNLTAAAIYLQSYIDSPDFFETRIQSDSQFPGFILNADIFDLAGLSVPRIFNNDRFSILGITGSYALLLAFAIFNKTHVESNFENLLPDLHLPMASYGFSYNDTYVNFEELYVAKEMDMITKLYDASLYTRYSSVLNYDDQLYISVIIESWSYTFQSNLNLTAAPGDWENFFGINFTGRVPAFKISFGFINTGDNFYNNLTVHAVFKADMYLNEKGIQNFNDIQFSEIMNAGNDDLFEYDAEHQMITVRDQYTEGDNATGEWTMMGYNSTSHALTGWEINKTDNIFNTLFSGKIPNYSNSSDPDVNLGLEDFGFQQSWFICEKLEPFGIEKFESILGIGKGYSEFQSYESMRHGFDRIINNITIPEIKDLAVVSTNTPRMNTVKQNFHSDVKIINLGNIPINDTEIYFVSNFTSGNDEGEVISKVFQIHRINPLEILSYSADWIPTRTGVFTVSWRISGISSLWSEGDDIPLNDFLSRVCVIYDYSSLSDDITDLILITPNYFPLEPFIVKYTGDVAMANLTVLSPLPLEEVTFSLSGLSSSMIDLEYNSCNTSSVYTQVGIKLFVPLAYQPNPHLVNLHITTNQRKGKFVLPIQFQLQENLGRVMFDGLHNQIIPDFEIGGSGLSDLSMDLEGNSLSGGFSLSDFLSERLETLYGNYYSLHATLSNSLFSEQKGIAMMQIIKGLDFKSMMGDSFNFNNTETSGNNSLLMEQIFHGDNFFKFSENFSSDYYCYDLIKFFDGIIFANPEVNFTVNELVALEKFMQLGGSIFIFTENNNKSNTTVLNQLLSLGNLTLGQQYNGSLSITDFSSIPSKISANISKINLLDPIQIVSTSNSTNPTYLIPNYLAVSNVGRGKMIAFGDNDIITQNTIVQNDHMQFIYNLVNFALDVRFDWDAGLTSDVIKYGENSYLKINLQNADLQYLLEEDFLALVSCVDDFGIEVPMQLFDHDSPILPMMKTNSTAYYAKIESTWIPKLLDSSNSTGIWVNLIIDSPLALTETLSFHLIIRGEVTENEWSIYQPPPKAYSDLFEILFLAIILLSIVIFWRSSNVKWRLRHRYVNVSDKMQNEVKTSLSSLQLSLNQISTGIQNSKFDELEKIRVILGNENKITELFKEIHEIAEELGER